MDVAIVKCSSGKIDGKLGDFIKRPAFDENAEKTARIVLEEIKRKGNAAVAKYCRLYDNAVLRPADFAVPEEALSGASRQISLEALKAVKEAHKRIVSFSRAGLKNDWHIATPKGGICGERFIPLDRVGVYIPGGASPLASTALMTVTLAKVAGVSEIVACTPCDKHGNVNPMILHALHVSGATEVYRVGGIQAIGMMALGTQTVRKVQKIVGPGGPYVTAAKRQVYGHVSLDLVAGPSEIAVLADETADVRCVAADLLSQSEHGTGLEKSLLVTTSMKFAKAVRKEIVRQTASLSRAESIRKVVQEGMLIVVVKTLSEGMDVCNMFAPEHFEIIVREPRKWLKRVKSAGAVFLGPWTPESVGDYIAGPSHVLPTGGAAAMFSGLTVDDFRRRSSYVSFTQADLRETLPFIETFGDMEGLDGHSRSARIRFEKE